MKRPILIILLLTCFAILLPISTTFAADRQKVFIAPTVDYHDYRNDDVYRLIEKRLKDNFNYPLNAIVHRYEILPETNASRQILQSLYTGKVKLTRDLLHTVAYTSGADVVVIPRLNRLSYITYTTWDGDLVQQTEISLDCYAYAIDEDKVYRFKTSRSYNNDYSTQGEPEYLLNDMLDEIISKLPYGRLATIR